MARPELVKTVANMLGNVGTLALGVGAAVALVNNALFSGAQAAGWPYTLHLPLVPVTLLHP
jgi:hypothetical protein